MYLESHSNSMCHEPTVLLGHHKHYMQTGWQKLETTHISGISSSENYYKFQGYDNSSVNQVLGTKCEVVCKCKGCMPTKTALLSCMTLFRL